MRHQTAIRMVYHLARVSHWSQERSVAHFATHYLAQIELAPLHEFNMLHLHLLSGTDRLDGYPQFLAFVVCVVASVRDLHAARRRCTDTSAGRRDVRSDSLRYPRSDEHPEQPVRGLDRCRAPRPPAVLARFGSVGRPSGPARASGRTRHPHQRHASGAARPCRSPPWWVRAALAEFRQRPPMAATRRIAAVMSSSSPPLPPCRRAFRARNYDLFDAPIGPVSESTRRPRSGLRPAAANIIRSTAVNFMIGNGESGIATFVSQARAQQSRSLIPLDRCGPRRPTICLGHEHRCLRQERTTEGSRYEDYGANPWHVLPLTFSGVLICFRAVRGDRTLRQAALLAVGLALGFIAVLGNGSMERLRYSLSGAAPRCVGTTHRHRLEPFPRLIGRVVILLLRRMLAAAARQRGTFAAASTIPLLVRS